jgi:iron complex outermembrane receptor protein
VDGIYGGRSRQFMSPFFDLERIEVLRGPQGALFGKNTAAGAISIISGQPTRDFTGSGHGHLRLRRKGLPALGLRLGAYQRGAQRPSGGQGRRQGWLHRQQAPGGGDEPDNKAQLARPDREFQPNDTFDYVAKAEYSFTENRGNGTVSGPLTAAQKPVKPPLCGREPASGRPASRR